MPASRSSFHNNSSELPAAAAATFRDIGIAATICIPLVKEARLTALMAIHHRDPHVWSDYELALIRDVTDRSWAHIERVGAEAELRKTAERLRDLDETLEMRVADRTAALDRSQTQFRLLVQGVTDYAIYMPSTAKAMSRAGTPGPSAIEGYRPDEIIGRHFSAFYREGRPRSAGAAARARDGAARRPLRRRRLADPQGRYALSRQRRDRDDP